MGHVIGCALLFFAGLIGGQTEKSSMETVTLSFGKKGSILFSWLNVIQLIGWTAIMIVNGAAAAYSVISFVGVWAWCIVIGVLIVIWISADTKNLGRINTVAMTMLFILTIILSVLIFKNSSSSNIASEAVSFGSAVELSVAMPLSWLPLISDYTRNAKKPFCATLASSITYFAASTWMYIIGMGAAILTNETNIALIMTKAGFGIAGLITVIFSTVTTTFLDAFSAGVSSAAISKKVKEKPAAIFIAVLGTVLAIFAPVSNLEGFLYFIGSVFAPMISIQITDYFILKKDYSDKSVNLLNLLIWFIGFIIYRVFMSFDTPIGYTLPAMVIICVLCIIADRLKRALL